MTDRRLDPSGDPGHGVPAVPWRPPVMPEDIRRIGLDRNTVEGAWVEFASLLDRRRTSHVVVAWLALAVFVVPVLLTLVGLLQRL
jgi:hypothetical protein